MGHTYLSWLLLLANSHHFLEPHLFDLGHCLVHDIKWHLRRWSTISRENHMLVGLKRVQCTCFSFFRHEDGLQSLSSAL